MEYVPDFGADDIVNGFYARVTDVTARRKVEKALVNSEHQLRTITDNLPAAIMHLDEELCLKFANATARKWAGQATDQFFSEIFDDAIPAAMYKTADAYFFGALNGGRIDFISTPELTEPGRIIQTILVPDLSTQGKVEGIFCLSNDISAQKQLESELRHMSRFDSLTGLPNRAHLYDSLELSIERSKRTTTSIAVLFLDIDHFKTINDSRGHRKGDLVLQEFAARLKKCIRLGNMVARLAGDEFVIVLESLKSIEQAEAIARKILKLISQPCLFNGERLLVTTSIGIAFDGQHVHFGSDLIAYADTSLYAAKAAGRNTFHSAIF